MSELGPESARAHVVVINRWREHYADYANYIDHTANRVTYISTDVGLGSVPTEATDIVLVEATDDLLQTRSALDELVRRHGKPHRIVALKEDDLLIGAQLRVEYGVPGDRPADLLPFRDKFLMCQAIESAGLPVPRFMAVDGPARVLDLADQVGWPIVLKPRVGSSSAGVVLLAGPRDLAELPAFTEPMLAQAFNPDPIHHVDGVFTGKKLVRCKVSRYVNTCLGFRDGDFLGSVEVDDPEVIEAVEAAATGFLGALTDGMTPFHLEVFVGHDGDRVTCNFLEVGARVGGSEIPFLWRELHGWDLMRVAFELQAKAPASRPGPASGEVGGWLLVPAPTERPCVITEATSMVGSTPGPYAEVLLGAGEVLPDADAYYEHVGGRFRFRGASSAEVEAALVATAGAFQVAAERVSPQLQGTVR